MYPIRVCGIALAFAFLYSRALAFVAPSAPAALDPPLHPSDRHHHRCFGAGDLCIERRVSSSTRLQAQGFGKAPKEKKSKPRVPTPSKPCLCFSGKPYGECCKPFHDGEKLPEPVQVMRARYAAYASAMPQYIMKSTHPEHEDFGKPGWSEELLEFCNNYRFTGLEVGAPEADPEAPGDKVFVYFTAMMTGAQRGGAVSFEERSLFVRQDGRWLYRSADKDYQPSVDVVSKRRFNRTTRIDKPKGMPHP